MPGAEATGLQLKPETTMPDDRNAENEKQKREEQTQTNILPLTPAGEVVLTHLDSPPASARPRIHPRRPAPIVPEGAPERADEDSTDK
jgi:hypothetical protein